MLSAPSHPTESEADQDQVDSAARRSVLVVDDEPSTASIVGKYLREAGFDDVLTVIDSRQVIAMVTALEPCLVVLDLCMPDVSGLDILTAMRQDDRMAKIPVIAISATTDDDLIDRIGALGVFALLRKPLQDCDVVAAAHRALGA